MGLVGGGEAEDVVRFLAGWLVVLVGLVLMTALQSTARFLLLDVALLLPGPARHGTGKAFIPLYSLGRALRHVKRL
jgi:hypothetical protein